MPSCVTIRGCVITPLKADMADLLEAQGKIMAKYFQAIKDSNQAQLQHIFDFQTKYGESLTEATSKVMEGPLSKCLKHVLCVCEGADDDSATCLENSFDFTVAQLEDLIKLPVLPSWAIGPDKSGFTSILPMEISKSCTDKSPHCCIH